MTFSVRILCLNFPSRILANESATSFPFGAFLLPEAITEANFPAEKRINRDWFASWPDPQKTGSQDFS